MNENWKLIWGCVGIVAVTVLAGILGTLWGGFVLTKLWGWFVVTTFGLDGLSLIQAVGLKMVVGLFVMAPSLFEAEDDTIDRWGKVGGVVFLAPAISLVLGWIIHLFM